MTRIDTCLLLFLSGLGWGCGFAVVGLAVFKGVPENGVLAAIFGAFGFAGGALLAAWRLAVERRLSTTLSDQRRAEVANNATVEL